ncbi:MAG: TonB-dependent receptor [Balneolaceae bacterium]
MKTVTIFKAIPVLVGLMVSAAISPVQGFNIDQTAESTMPEMVTYYSVNQYGSDISELTKRISLELRNITRAEALFQIAQKAGLEIAFDAGILEGETISMNDSSIQVSDALEEALEGTNYESVITPQRQILLMEKTPVAETSEEDLRVEVTGRVIDEETEEPLQGVTVFVVGTQVGTTTDVDGRFSLDVPDDAEIIAFSYIGYVRQEVTIGDNVEFNISLVSDVAMIDDIVVVGYGVQRRTEVTGAVSSIRAETIQGTPSSSFENALQGRLAGVNVSESTGEPGAAPQITIRGVGSISAGNEPLYVIDGVPLSQNSNLQQNVGSQNANFTATRVNPLATLNPNDIESIEILKDASAAAIYGSRGSNGVILITTKRGQSGSPTQINLRSYTGVSSAFNTPDLMSAEELIAYTKDSRNTTYLREHDPNNTDSEFYNPNYNPDTNAGRPEEGEPGYSVNYLIPDQYVNWDGTDTDWLDLVMDTAVMQNHDMSISGGSETFTYFLGGGFMDQGGIIDGSGFNRYSLNTNLTADLSDRFQVGMGLNAAFTIHDRKSANAPYFGNPPGIIYSALTQSPVVSPYNDDGSYRQLEGSHNELGAGTTTTNHPLAVRDFIDEEIKNNRIFGNIYGSYDIMENMQFKSLLGYDIDNYQRSFYQGTQFYYRGGDPRPYAESTSAQGFNWLWENTLSYQTSFGEDHRLDTVVGFTSQKQNDERNRVIAQNFPDDQVKTVNGGQITGGDQLIEEWSLVSYLARANYVFKDRYLLTGTIRSDRSSRFGTDNQTGVFPSGSIGWQMTNESFMQDQTLFNELKPRVSYGMTGNFLIPNYGSIGLISSSNYVLSDQLVNGVSPTTLGNSELTWETTKQFNVGLDYAMLEDRFYGSFDYYVSTTEDLLLEVNIPAVTGFTRALTNIGEVENKGFEVQLTSRNLVGDFQWSTDFNFSTNKNEVLSLGPEGDAILVPGAAGVRHITRIGDAIGSYYGHEVEGIFQTQQEIDNAPVDTQGDPAPGDFRFKDVNDDGVIDGDDRTIVGSYHPDYTWGITNRFNWKNIDFSFFIQGVEGREVLNLTSRHLRNGEANFASYAILNDRWISPEQPGNGIDPRADRVSIGNNNRPSSYQVEDGSYIKLRNITLGYNLPVELISNFARNVRFYGSVTNVAIWSDYLGFNPEVNLSQGSGLTPGEDYGAYPLSRSFQFGVDISF